MDLIGGFGDQNIGVKYWDIKCPLIITLAYEGFKPTM